MIYVTFGETDVAGIKYATNILCSLVFVVDGRYTSVITELLATIFKLIPRMIQDIYLM